MNFIVYCIFRALGSCIALMPYPLLHALGRGAGTCAYYLHRSFRKKAMTNLSIAFGSTKNLSLGLSSSDSEEFAAQNLGFSGEVKSEEELKRIAKLSFQNLMITLLEFFRFKRSKGRLSEIVTLQDDAHIEPLLGNKHGIVFLSAHQANWEIPFLALTDRYSGVAIGRPIKNTWLYKWVLSVREMNGGKIVMPKNAIRSGLKALSKGEFLGIVGDQAYPESPYSYPLFGTRAWTASTPALLAYKTGCPLVAGTCERTCGRYIISGSPPIWPNLSAPIKEEVPRMMDIAMSHLEASIAKRPEQWMWVHDRWKQQGIDHVKRQYRFGFILVILPPDPTPQLEMLPLLRKIYPRSFLTIFAPPAATIDLPDCTVSTYTSPQEMFVRDWRFQLVLDFYGLPKLRRHFLKLGAFKALDLHNMQPEAVKHKLVKPECLMTVSS